MKQRKNSKNTDVGAFTKACGGMVALVNMLALGMFWLMFGSTMTVYEAGAASYHMLALVVGATFVIDLVYVLVCLRGKVIAKYEPVMLFFGALAGALLKVVVFAGLLRLMVALALDGFVTPHSAGYWLAQLGALAVACGVADLVVFGVLKRLGFGVGWRTGVFVTVMFAIVLMVPMMFGLMTGGLSVDSGWSFVMVFGIVLLVALILGRLMRFEPGKKKAVKAAKMRAVRVKK